jgi:hypothetical protein
MYGSIGGSSRGIYDDGAHPMGAVAMEAETTMHTLVRLAIGLLAVGFASAAPSAQASWCTKGTTLKGLEQRFPLNLGPDIVVRVDLGESLQQAVDTATDLNGDQYIIVAAVSNGNGDPHGYGIQRVVVDRTFPLPFGLFGCSLTLVDPNPADGLPTIHITADAAGPDIFAMDLHGTGSDVAGWRVEGNGRYVRNAYARDNAIGYWFTGDGNTLLNGVTERSAVAAVRFEGSSNSLIGNKAVTSQGVGFEIIGDHNLLKQDRSGDRGDENGGDGIRVIGAGNVLQENQVFANGGHGIDISGGTAADPNVIRRNSVGDRGKGNAGHGIFVHDSAGNGLANPLEIEQNTTRSNGLHGMFIADTATGHELKGNVSGGSSDLDNRGCEFLVAAGNWNATGNKANGITIPGRDGDPFPTGCLGTP